MLIRLLNVLHNYVVYEMLIKIGLKSNGVLLANPIGLSNLSIFNILDINICQLDLVLAKFISSLGGVGRHDRLKICSREGASVQIR
jgi:hypothetical protein